MNFHFISASICAGSFWNSILICTEPGDPPIFCYNVVPSMVFYGVPKYFCYKTLEKKTKSNTVTKSDSAGINPTILTF